MQRSMARTSMEKLKWNAKNCSDSILKKVVKERRETRRQMENK